MQNTPFNRARLYVSILFLSSVVAVILGGILGLFGNVAVMLFFVLFGLLMLTVSIGSALYLLNKQRTVSSEALNMPRYDKAQAATGIGEILLYMFVSK